VNDREQAVAAFWHLAAWVAANPTDVLITVFVVVFLWRRLV
jgi:hypothetical protein